MNEFLMWNPEEPRQGDVWEQVSAAFAAGLRPDPIVEDPSPTDLPPELIEALVRDTLRGHLDALIPVLAREIAQQLR